MAEIRLNKIIKTYNIGLQKLVDFLASKGVEVEANPNVKISEYLLPAIDKQFEKDKATSRLRKRLTSNSTRFWKRHPESSRKAPKRKRMNR